MYTLSLVYFQLNIELLGIYMYFTDDRTVRERFN